MSTSACLQADIFDSNEGHGAGTVVRLDDRARGLMSGLRELRSRQAARFASLAGSPERFTEMQDEIAAADAEIRNVARRLGTWLALNAEEAVADEAHCDDVSEGGCDPETELANAPNALANTDPVRRVLTQEEVRRQLDAHFKSLQMNRTPEVERDDPALLRALLKELGLGADPPGKEWFQTTVDNLPHLTSDRSLDRFARCSSETNRTVLSLLTVLVRAVEGNLDEGERRQVLARLRNHSACTRPGHVNGLARNHAPTGDSWQADVLAAVDALQRAAGMAKRPGVSEEPTSGSLALVRVRSDRDEEPTEIRSPLPSELQGLRVVLVGGSPREPRRSKLQRRLGCAALEWREAGRPRELEALIHRIAQGSVDIVLVLCSLISHKDADRVVDSARVHGVRVGMVPRGYGEAAIRHAIMDNFAGSTGPDHS